METPHFFKSEGINLNAGAFDLSLSSNTNIFGKPKNDNLLNDIDCPPPIFSNRKFVEMEYNFPTVEKVVVPVTECVIVENNQSIIDEVYFQNENDKNDKVKVLLNFVQSLTQHRPSIFINSFCASLKSYINFYIGHNERMKKGMIPHSPFLNDKEREELSRNHVEYFIHANELLNQFDFVYRNYYENIKDKFTENFSDANLIDYLYEKTLEYDLDIESTSFISKKIFSMTFEPYSYFLSSWVFLGELSPVQNEYFIELEGSEYVINETPLILQKHKDVIFKCGILVQLMKYIDKICQTTYFLPNKISDLIVYWKYDSILILENNDRIDKMKAVNNTKSSFIPIDVAIEKCIVQPIKDQYESICNKLSHLLLNRNLNNREISQLQTHPFGNIFKILIDSLNVISQENMPIEAKIVRLSNKIMSEFNKLSINDFVKAENSNMDIE